MHLIYKNYLFKKHFFVNDASVGVENKDTDNSSAKAEFEVMFSLANLFGIKIVKGAKLLTSDMIRFASLGLGENVPEPFYKGFPESVRKLTKKELIYDQLLNYMITYGFGNFEDERHSVFEEKFETAAFKENIEVKEFSVLSEKEAEAVLEDIVRNLLAGTRPLSLDQYGLVVSYITDYSFVPEEIASKNTAIRLLMDLRDTSLARFLYMSDVPKLVDEINYTLYHNENVKKLNLKNQDRRFITFVIDTIFESGRVDIRNCYEKKKVWSGLLHHIHYKAKSEEAQQFLDAMRGSENLSVYSSFEKAMTEKNIRAAVDELKSGKGTAAVLRRLNYIISRCESEEELEQILASLDTNNVIVLLQLLIQYVQYKSKNVARTFTFTKHNLLKVHNETEEEQAKRKSAISEEQAKILSARIAEKLANLLKGRLGKVYIDPDMRRYALPIQETTTQGGFGVLTRGSRIQIPDTKKLRAFTYWEKVQDIDLSVFGINDKGEQTEFSWRTMGLLQSEGITYSGDVTNGYYGGSEYFDIDYEKFKLKHPDIRYLIFCNNVFSALPFSQVYCKAGYMTRDKSDSGRVYEPKTVKSSFVVNAESTFAYLFGIDLRTNEFVWLNMSRSSGATVAGTTDMSFLTDYFHVTDIINVYTFFELMATEIVSDISEAEVVVTNKNVECGENVQVIREYDIDKMIQLMNV